MNSDDNVPRWRLRSASCGSAVVVGSVVSVDESLWCSVGSLSPSTMDLVLGQLLDIDVSSVFSVQEELKLVVSDAAAMLSATRGKAPFAWRLQPPRCSSLPRRPCLSFIPLAAALLEVNDGAAMLFFHQFIELFAAKLVMVPSLSCRGTVHDNSGYGELEGVFKVFDTKDEDLMRVVTGWHGGVSVDQL